MNENTTTMQQDFKFCKECGQKIAKKAVICPHCGCQIEQTQAAAAPSIVINNSNQNQNVNNMAAPFGARPRNKWVALLLCWFLGFVGAHKFYEGKAGRGLLYIFTFGLLGIGVFVDFINLLCKPNPYYVF